MTSIESLGKRYPERGDGGDEQDRLFFGSKLCLLFGSYINRETECLPGMRAIRFGIGWSACPGGASKCVCDAIVVGIKIDRGNGAFWGISSIADVLISCFAEMFPKITDGHSNVPR